MARKNDAFYYDSFREHAALSCKAAELLHEVMSSYNVEEFKAAVDKMHAIEQGGRREEARDQRRPRHRLCDPDRARGYRLAE